MPKAVIAEFYSFADLARWGKHHLPHHKPVQGRKPGKGQPRPKPAGLRPVPKGLYKI